MSLNNLVTDNMKNMLKDVYTSGKFSDVTLVCDDKIQLQVHKLVLSASSPILANILKAHSQCEVQLYLHGIYAKEMKYFLEMIYLGHTSIETDKINAFDDIADSFKISNIKKDLTDQTLNHGSDLDSNRQELIETEDPQSLVEVHVKENSTVELSTEYLELKEETKETKHKIKLKSIVKKFMIFPCNICEYKAATTSKLKLHVRSVHERVKLPCKQCDKKFSQQGSLAIHINTVHRGIQYPCHLCDFKASRPGYLNNHERAVHDGIKYPCKLCDFRSSRRNNLKLHVKSIHEGVQYPCKECDFKASRPNHLNTHIKSVHKGLKSHCKDCGKVFRDFTCLQTHIKSVHSGITYPCKHCNHRFTRKDNLNTHIKSKHEGFKFPCNKCNSDFPNQKALNGHIESMHEEHEVSEV